MNLQQTAVHLLHHVSDTLLGLGEGASFPAECRYASAKYAEAAERLSVEPCGIEDIRAARTIMKAAIPTMQKVDAAKLPDLARGWFDAVVYSQNAVMDLLSALESFHKHISLDKPEAQTMAKRLQRLIPAGWWGSR